MTSRKHILFHTAIIATTVAVLITSAIYFGYPAIRSKSGAAHEYGRIALPSSEFTLESKQWLTNNEDKEIGPQPEWDYIYSTNLSIANASKVVSQALSKAGYSISDSQGGYIIAAHKNYSLMANMYQSSVSLPTEVSIYIGFN